MTAAATATAAAFAVIRLDGVGGLGSGLGLLVRDVTGLGVGRLRVRLLAGGTVVQIAAAAAAAATAALAAAFTLAAFLAPLGTGRALDLFGLLGLLRLELLLFLVVLFFFLVFPICISDIVFSLLRGFLHRRLAGWVLLDDVLDDHYCGFFHLGNRRLNRVWVSVRET